MDSTALLNRLTRLPVMPGLALRLIKSLADERMDRAGLARMIAADPALSAELLRMANSPFYGFSEQISALDEALNLLGLNLVRRIATATVLGRSLAPLLPTGAVAQDFWHQQLMVAALSHELASNSEAESAYMAGLLHKIGLLALATLPEGPGISSSGNEALQLEQERRQFGLDHAELGAALLRAWHLPAPLVDAARLHVAQERPVQAMAEVVWRARRLMLEIKQNPAVVEDPSWLRSRGLDGEALKRQLELVQQLCNEFTHAHRS